MPRVIRSTLDWLSRPSPGHDVFAPSAQQAQSQSGANGSSAGDVQFQNGAPPPSRKVAIRGTQIFVAVQNELRWSDLSSLKKQYEGRRSQGYGTNVQSIEGEGAATYRILKVPVHDEIRQLALSPNHGFLAVATAHTVHIALLPDRYHLDNEDVGPLRVKTFQVGPTTHVLGRSPISALLWHPLGVDGTCLTTITEDATVRLWEFDVGNRMSVNTAALALDLKRLANGVSSQEDFSPSKYGAASFSAEMPYMEVAAACYGGTGGSDVQRDPGWATSTLWIGMKDGGLYALCPLLPSKFAAPPKLIDELAASACLNANEVEDGSDTSKESLRTAVDQLNWVNGIEKHHRGDDFDVNLTVYNRPSRPGAIPMLQGPYYTEPDADALFDITDVLVMAQTSTEQAIEEDDDFELVGDDGEEEQIPVSAVCVATSDGRIHICFDVKGTEGRWLPPQKGGDGSAGEGDDTPLPELLLMDSVEVDTAPTLGRPMFSRDLSSRAGFFVTHSQGVTHVSLASMMDRIVEETAAWTEAGGSFRLKLAMENGLAEEEEMIRLPRPLLGPEAAAGSSDTSGQLAAPSACVALRDSELGDIILTHANGRPYAALLDYTDLDYVDSDYGGDLDMDADADADNDLLHGQAARDTFQVPDEFYASTALPSIMKHFFDQHPRRLSKDKMRISPLDLDMMTEAHHVLAAETHRVNDAVGRLFGRTQRLQHEYEAQIQRADEMREQIDSVIDDDDDARHDEEPATTVENIDRRMDQARMRQDELQERFDALRDQMAGLDRRPLNTKEKEWVHQIEEVRDSVEAAKDGTDDGQGEQKAWQRMEGVREWKEQLVEQCQGLASDGQGQQEQVDASPGNNKSTRRGGTTAAMRNMLERERAMVEATRKKLDELLSVKLGES